MFMVEHITTVPYNPRSNGWVECFVDIFKIVLRKQLRKVWMS